MVSLLSQYVIFNGFLRNIFSFIFLTQRKMAELYSDYDTYTILFFSVCFKRLDFQSSVLHEDNKIEGKSSESKCFVCYLFGVVQQKTGLFQLFILYNLHLCAQGLVYLKAFFLHLGKMLCAYNFWCLYMSDFYYSQKVKIIISTRQSKNKTDILFCNLDFQLMKMFFIPGTYFVHLLHQKTNIP